MWHSYEGDNAMMNEEIKLSTENTEEEIFKEDVEYHPLISKTLDVWDKVRPCCYFIPIITTVAVVLSFAYDLPIYVDNYIIFPMVFVGWIAALLTGPFRLLKLILKFISFVGQAAIVGIFGCIGFILCLNAIEYIFLFAPAIITIIYFFRDYHQNNF